MTKGMQTQIEWVIEDYHLPEVKVGQVVNIRQVWDGRHENPLYDKRYSYQLSPYESLTYRWKIKDEQAQTVLITEIEFI